MSSVSDDLQYQTRWEYVVQSEERRDRAGRWYFVVVAALLSVAYTDPLASDLSIARPIILGFLTLYSVATIAYLIALKLPYREHVGRIRHLDNSTTKHKDEGCGAFSWYVYSITSVASFLSLVAWLELSRPAVGESPRVWGWVVEVLFALAVGGLAVRYTVSQLRETESEDGNGA